MGTLAGELAENLTDYLETRGLAVLGTHADGVRSRMHQWWILVLGVAAVIIGATAQVLIVTATGHRAAGLAVEITFVALVIIGVGAIRVRLAARGMTPKG